MEFLKFNNKKLLLLLFFLILSFSFGNFLRWDLNEQIGMADNYMNFENFYPIDSEMTTVSVYPPGVSFISLVFMKIGFDEYVTELMLILSSILIILTIFLFIKIIQNSNNYTRDIVPMMIIYILIICPEFLDYASEFKPDLVSFLFCFTGLYLFDKSRNISSILTGALLISISCIFKQQSISFIFGILIYTSLNFKDKKILLFGLLSTLGYAFFSFKLYSDYSVYKWGIEILSDDGLLSIKSILKHNWHLFNSLILFSILGLLLIKKYSLLKIKNINNPYLFVGITILGVAFISSLKNGGNDGNTQVGFFYLLPYFFTTFNFKFKGSIRIVALLTIVMSLNLYKFYNLKDYITLKGVIKNLAVKDYEILTDSDSYVLARGLTNKKIKNLNTGLLMNEKDFNLKNHDLVILREGTISKSVLLENDFKIIHKNVIVIGLKE